MSNILFTALFVVVGCFMASRVYAALTRGELNVKGSVYSKDGTPIAFTATTIFAILGTLFAFIMAAIGILAIIESR